VSTAPSNPESRAISAANGDSPKTGTTLARVPSSKPMTAHTLAARGIIA
jgi:hypothetical protein